MVVGQFCLRNAEQLLAAWSGDRQRLAQAAEFCWLAGFWFLVDWPERLREHYGCIFRGLIGPWTFGGAIEALDEVQARHLADELRRLIRESLAEAATRCEVGLA
ncbi:MAG TPA: hypothetical protein VML55_07445 [Planctomycetaceae bacterium]|nr:hypothetical protein [Planctomycetaceae bacterium]